MKDVSRYIVRPSLLSSKITVPSSKSQTLRAILFGALATGKSTIFNPLFSPDSYAMMEACRHLGAKIEIFPEKIVIEGTCGKVTRAEDIINAQNSGLVLRFCSAVGALSTHPIVVTGDHSIRYQRPMRPLLKGLEQLGVSVRSLRGDDYAPVIIQGPIKGGKIQIDGEDSQPVSALLVASAFAKDSIEITVQNPGEKPWVALTLDWFDKLGIGYHHDAYKKYTINGNSSYKGFQYGVPGDFSSAAFPIAAALITNSEIIIENIDMNDPQGDKELILTLKNMGADIEIDEQKKQLFVKKGNPLKGLSIDINNFIDAIAILAVIGCFAEGETRIYNAAVARQKECDRIHCLATELRKLGADIHENEEGLTIRKSALKGAIVDSHQDHRMAMALTVAGLGCEGETVISSTDCISKTYPSFLSDFKRLGANILRMP